MTKRTRDTAVVIQFPARPKLRVVKRTGGATIIKFPVRANRAPRAPVRPRERGAA